MSILGSIVSSIFHHAGVSSAQAAPASPGSSTAPASGSSPASGGVMPPKQPANSVDVTGVLTKLASQNKEKLDWQHSIVDLMKLLNLDSSLHARKELAQELHYTGDTNDSAKMNMWLHAQVLEKLAENGGKVPADLMHK
jgi:3-oxoacyl-ACP reductase-like protein